MINVTKEMIKGGNEIASQLSDIAIQKEMKGLGNEKPFSLLNFPKENWDILKRYENNEINFITAIFIKMREIEIANISE